MPAKHAPIVALPSGPPVSNPEKAQPGKLLHEYLGSPPASPAYAYAASEFLIAAVPDPQTTNLALFSDRALESLTWAIDDSHYSFERYWIPWQTKADSELSLLADRKLREKETENRHNQPGVLIFRQRNDVSRPPLLVVLLVGEAPSSGLNKAALTFAVDYIRKRTKQELRIVGPTFSGSLQPLANYLRAAYPHVAIRMVSGTISSLQAIHQFRAAVDNYVVKNQYVVENDKRAGKLFFDFISKEWYRPEEFGLLSEDDTAYGNVAEQIIAGVKEEGKSHGWLSVRYPREISRLRNAPQSVAPSENKKSSGSVLESVSQDLKESSGDSAGPLSADSVPAFSKIQSPASQQAAMLQISSALKREHVEYTGIIATDVLDSLFLARFLRQSVPDSRIFTFGADLLFPRENQTAPLEGVLAVTTYPLISRNQHWTAAELSGGIPRRVPFTSHAAEGIYNAGRYLLEGWRDCWNTPANGELLLEYRRPETAMRTHHPPLWLTVVGRQGYWPVALLDDEDKSNRADSSLLWLKDGQIERTQEALHPENPAGGWYFCVGLVVLLAFLHCLYVFKLMIRWQFGAEFFNVLASIFRVYPKEKITAYEAPFLLAATAVFACVLFFLVSSANQFGGEPHTISQTFIVVVVVTIILLFIVGVWLTVLFRREQVKHKVEAYGWVLIPTIFCAILFCIIIESVVDHRPFLTGYFFAYRALNITTGVCPSLPILILAGAYFYWAWVQLRREQLSSSRRCYDAERKKIRQPSPSMVKALQDPAEYIGKMEECAKSILAMSVLRPALILTLVWACSLAPWWTVRSLEGRRYDWLYRGLLVLLFYMTSVCYTHLIQCWHQFRNFLQALERSPIRTAFSRLRKQITWVPLIVKMPEHQYLLTTLSHETLKVITAFQFSGWVKQKRWERRMKQIHSDVTAVDQLAPNLEKELQATGRPDKTKYAQLQIYLDNIASEFTCWLEGQDSWGRGGSESLEQEREQFKKDVSMPEEKQLQVLEEEFVALRYLVFMRYIFRHLRNLLGFIIAGFIAIVLSLNSYPFEGQHWIGLIIILSFLVFGVGIAVVFAEMDRDAILSRLTDTKANELSKNFLFRLLQYGTLPFLTVLSAQFPWIQKTVLSALQPALEALH